MMFGNPCPKYFVGADSQTLLVLTLIAIAVIRQQLGWYWAEAIHGKLREDSAEENCMSWFRFGSLIIAAGVWLCSWLIAPAAIALIPIKLTDISYHECPPELAKGAITPGTSMAANCFIVTGKAQNTTGKPIVNADIFGRIYDANDNPVMQNRTRLGSIEEVPPGTSDFEMRISVPINQPTPLQLKQFKASGFSGTVRR